MVESTQILQKKKTSHSFTFLIFRLIMTSMARNAIHYKLFTYFITIQLLNTSATLLK